MKRERSFRWYDAIILPIAAIIMLAYIAFSSGVFGKEYQNVLSNAVFAILNMVMTIWFMYKISYFVTTSQSYCQELCMEH